MEEAVKANNYEKFKEVASIKKNAGNYGNKEISAGDTVLRKVVLEYTIDGISPEKLDELLTFALKVTRDDLCSKTIVGSLALDAVELSPLEECDALFDVVAKHEAVWQADPLYFLLKPSILRVCNSLIKRLSPQSEARFSGKITKFLARRLPLCEPSGLNKPGMINNEYTTTWQEFKEEEEPQENGEAEEEKVESMETDDLEQGEIKEEEGPSLPPEPTKPDQNGHVPLDKQLYAKFWKMQTFFASPNDAHNAEKFKDFKDCLESIFEAFKTHKVQKRRKRKRLPRSRSGAHEGVYEAEDLLEGLDDLCAIEPGSSFDAKRDELFCCRYFTDFDFFEQQISDLKIRRCFLVQCLILLQYLQTEAKIKDKSMKLTATQNTFVTQATQTCYDLLAEKEKGSAKFAARFAESVRNVLDREEYWNKWKNRKEMPWTTEVKPADAAMPAYKKRPRQQFSLDEIDLGNDSMTRIWNNSGNILEDCEKRRFYPKAKEFLADPLEELDPESQIEDAYLSVHNDDFQFRTSRFLSRQGLPYFMCNTSGTVIENFTNHLKKAVIAGAKDVPEMAEQATAIELARTAAATPAKK